MFIEKHDHDFDFDRRGISSTVRIRIERFRAKLVKARAKYFSSKLCELAKWIKNETVVSGAKLSCSRRLGSLRLRIVIYVLFLLMYLSVW